MTNSPGPKLPVGPAKMPPRRPRPHNADVVAPPKPTPLVAGAVPEPKIPRFLADLYRRPEWGGR